MSAAGQKIINFTQHPFHYPLYTQDMCSVGVSENRLYYVFSAEKAASVFKNNLDTWMRSGQLSSQKVAMQVSQPWKEKSQYFPARPEVFSFYVIVDFGTSSHPLKPFQFSQIVGRLGALQQLSRPTLAQRSTSLPPDAPQLVRPTPSKLEPGALRWQ